MYERYYGLSGPPFQINPDPGFYFESKGHASAYQYLRFGAFQGEGFIVVTGEIGAGKTTLVRALLAELDPARVVAAQLVSTQLAADELLSAVALAFGIKVDGLTKAKQLVTLEAFLASLAASQRRALLIIDEAQNLGQAAIEELRMLSNFQFGNRALLQSFLIGQPELRNILRMEQLRQRVLASCHLGPMQRAETRGYIEHRMRRVGWNQRPAFEAGAFDAIHEATAGVPRRINTLCNRLLMSAMLDEAETIDARRVRMVEQDLSAEITGKSPVSTSRAGAADDEGWLMCVAASRQGVLAAGALLRALGRREDLPQARIVRFVGDDAIDEDAAALRDLEHLGVSEPGVRIDLSAPTRAERVAEAATALSTQFHTRRPASVLLCDHGVLELACALVAEAAHVPLVYIAAQAEADLRGERRRHARLLEQSASLCFAAGDDEVERLGAQGVDARDLHHAGSLAVDVTLLDLPHAINPEQTLRREGVAPSVLTDPAGYVVLAPSEHDGAAACERVIALDNGLRKHGWRVSLLWPVAQGLRDEMADRCAHAMATGVRVMSLRSQAEWLGLLRHARCVISDSAWLRDQAATLGVPGLRFSRGFQDGARQAAAADPGARRLAAEIAEIIASGGRRPPLAPLSDGRCAERIAAWLSDWLLARQDPSYEQFLEGARRGSQARHDPADAPSIAGGPTSGI